MEQNGKVSGGDFQLHCCSKNKMAELTNRVSNEPNSFFDSKTVAVGGRGDGPCFFIPCGRDVGQNGKVSGGIFQVNSSANKNIILTIMQQPTCLFGGFH